MSDAAEASPAVTPSPRPPNRVRITWRGDEAFEAGKPGGPTGLIDGHGKRAQGPVDWLLSALAACSATDAVQILAKRRTPVETLEVEVTGHRVDGVPRRLCHIMLRFDIRGAGIERAHAERAVELAVTKYCSVRDSLARDIQVEWTIVLNGEAA